jgi:hypothetical protein
MRRAILIFGMMCGLFGPVAERAGAQTNSPAEPPPEAVGAREQASDGVAARIEDDILTESEIRELAAFQQLADGQAKARPELIRELADQWIVRGEANAIKFPVPSHADVDHAFAEFARQIGSREQFEARLTAAGITEAAVRRILEQQLYLSRFIDYRFRSTAQVNEQQVQQYYDNEFAPQLKARGESVPALEDVEDTIREVLVRRGIDDRAAKWLDDTRGRLKIDILSNGGNS